MKKSFLIMKNGQKVQVDLTFDEYYNMFKNDISMYTDRYMTKFPKYISKGMLSNFEREDIKQEISIAFWRAYEDYDIDTGYCITTYISNKVRGAVGSITQTIYRKKRSGDWDKTSLDVNHTTKNGQTATLLEKLGGVDYGFENLEAEEMRNFILSYPKTKNEKLLVDYMFNKENRNPQSYADAIGITKANFFMRVKRYRRKMLRTFKGVFLN